MKHSQRKGNISRRWEWLRSWFSEVGEVWVGLWVESLQTFGATPGNLLKRMVGLGGLEPPTSPLSGARSSHLSYRPIKKRKELRTTCSVYDALERFATATLANFRRTFNAELTILTSGCPSKTTSYCTNPTVGVGDSGPSLIGPNCAS
jgi:hypothetical protein